MEENAGNKQGSEKVDEDESNERYTPAVNELTADKDIEGNENAANSASKVEQTNEETPGISSCMVRMDDKELAEGNELIQENDNHEVHVNSVISSEESSSETSATLSGEKDSLEEKLKRDNTLMREIIVINERNDFAEIVDEKNQVEKKESLNKMDEVMVALEDTTNSTPDNSYNPEDKNEEVRDDDNQNDKVGDKHEEASNSSIEGQAREGNNSKENTEISTVDGGTSQDHELASELLHESDSQETRTEIEDTQIEKSNLDENMAMKISGLSKETEAAKDESVLNTDSNNSDVLKETIQEEGGKLEGTVGSVYEELDQNSSNTILSTDDFRNDPEAANKGNISSNELDVVEGSTYDGEMHGDVNYSSIKEVSQSINKDIYLIKQEEDTDFESTSHSVSQEHCQDKIADSEAKRNDISTLQEFDSLGTPVDGVSISIHPKEYDGEATDQEEAIQQTSTAANENEGNDTELIAEKDVDKKTEEKGGMEGDAREGVSFHEEQMASEKLDNNNESEHGESSGAVERSAVDETLETVIEREKWKENYIEELSEVESGETISTEEGTYIQDSENASKKQEECVAKKDEVGPKESFYKPDNVNAEYKHDVVIAKPEEITSIAKPEEITSSAREEQTPETVTTNIRLEVDGQAKGFSQNLKTVQDSVPEDNIKEIIMQNDSSKIENSAADCILKHMICEAVAPNVEKENAKNEANVDEDFDECPCQHASVEETIQGEVGQENGEGSSCTSKEQIHQVTSTKDKIEVDVSEEEKEAPRFKSIPESQPEDECPKGEPDAIKNVKLTNDDNSEITDGSSHNTTCIDLKDTIPDVVELNEHVESTNENDDANLNIEKVDSPDSHTMSVLPEQIGKYEVVSKTEHGEQIYQAIHDKYNTIVTIREQKADLEEPETLTELVPKGDNQGDARKPISTNNTIHIDTLDKVIHQIVSHNDDPETAKVENENVLEKDTGDVSDTPDLVAEAPYDGVAGKHEDSRYRTNNEDRKEAMVQGEKDTLIINLEVGHEAQNQDANGETECAPTEKALHPDEHAKVSALSAGNDSYAPTGSNLMEMVVGQGYVLESDDKPETTNIFEVTEEEIPNKEGTAENILEKTLNDVHTNFTEVARDNQIDGGYSRNVNTNSELTGCEEKQKFDEVMPEVSDRDQHKERYDKDDNAIEENPQSSMEIGTVETSEEGNQVMKVDAYECQDSKENVECKEASLDNDMHDASKVVLVKKVISMPEDDSTDLSVISKNEQKEEEQDVQTSSQKDELEVKPEEKEHEIQREQKSDESSNAIESNENESFKEKEITDNDPEKEKLEDLKPEKSPDVVLDDLETTIGAEDACESETTKQSTENNVKETFPNDGDTMLLESATGLEQANQCNKSTSITEGSSRSEEIQEANDGESKDKETTTFSDRSLPDVHASKEETGQVENSQMEVGDSPYAEQTAVIRLGEDVNLALTEVNTTDRLEKDYTSMIGKEDHEELSGKGVCENDKNSKEDRTNDEEASGSSLIAQEVGGEKLEKADEVLSEERQETLEPEKDKGEEIPMDKEVYNKCLGESSKNDFIEPIVAEIERLPHTMPDKAEKATNDADEKEKDAELVTQIGIEAMGDNLHDNKYSLGVNIHGTSKTVPEENVISMPEDYRKNENTEEQDAQTSLQREELENKPQENEYEIQIDQKTDEASNEGENNESESLKEKDTTENDSKKETLEDHGTKKSPNVVLNDLETTIRNEYAHESETKEQFTDNQNEDFLKDEDIKLVASAIELEHGNQSDKSTLTNEESSPNEEDVVENVAKVEGSLLQMESVEPETHEKAEQSDSTATQNEEKAGLSEPLNIKLHNDKKEIMQLEEGLTTSLGSQEITHRIENIEKTSVYEEDAAGSSHEQIQEDETRAKENIDTGSNSVPNDEVKGSEGGELNDKETTTTSGDSIPDIAASNEETGQVENANEQVGDSPYAEQIESICLSEGVNLDMLIKPDRTEHLERGYVSMIDKQDHEELNGKEVCENNKTSEDDETNDGQASGSSLPAQEVEGGEPTADYLVSKEKQEMLEQENNKGSEILKEDEVYNACVGVSLKSGFNKPIANEVDSLSHEEKAEVTNDTNENFRIEHAADAELVIQMDNETMDDNLHVNDAPLDKRMHNSSEVIPQEKVVSMPQDNSIEVIAASENENKEEQDVQTSLQKEELEDELREKENGIQTVQEPDGSSNASQKNENESFKEKDTIENNSEKEKMECPEPELALEYLEATTGNGDTRESESNKECPENKNVKDFLNDGEMKLVDSGIESEPSHQSDKSTHTIEEPSHGEETVNIEGLVEDVAKVDAHNNEGNNCKIVGDMPVTHDMVEDSKYIGPSLQRETVEPETHEKSRQSDSIAAQNEEILDISEQLNIESHKDAKELMQLEKCSTTLLGSQEINDGIENIQRNIVSEEDAVGSSHEQIQNDEIRATENIETSNDSVPSDEVKESEGVELKDKQVTTMGSDSFPDNPASNEESRQVEEAYEKAVESPYAEQNKIISLSEGVNLDTLTKPYTSEDSERDNASMINKQDHESGKGVCEKDKKFEEDGTRDGGASGSRLLAQEVEGGELKEADELVSEEKRVTLELQKNIEEEIPTKDEIFATCLGVSANNGFNKPTTAEVESLSHELTEKAEEATYDTDGKAKDAELVTQMDIETMADDLHVNKASLDKRMCNSSGVVPEEKVPSTPEDNKIEVGATSNNENKEEQNFQTIIQREELEDELQENENEIQMEQKSDESSNASQKSINESFIEKDATENDKEEENLEVPEPQKSPNVFLVDLETMIGNEDTKESETNKDGTNNKNEKNFLNDGGMMLADSVIESEPSNQSEKSNHTEGSSHCEEVLNVEGLVGDVANIDTQANEENYCKIVGDFSVTHDFVEVSINTGGAHLRNESVELETHDKVEHIDSNAAEIESDTLNVELQHDTKELVPVEELTTVLLGGQAITDGIEKIERNAASEEEAVGSSHEQIQEDDTQARKNTVNDTDYVPHDEVKDYNHQTSNECIMMMNKSENLETSSTMASVAEETKQEHCENFSKISDYWPREYNEETSTGSEIDKEHPKEMRSYAEQPDEDGNFTSTSADSTAIQEKNLKGEEGYVTEASILDATHAEGREELNEASDFVPKEEVAQKISSSIELTEDKENLHEESAMQEPQVNQLEVTTETEQLTGNASPEVEVDNLPEENQQTGMGELPVSQFLMKYILQEEGDMHKEATAEKCEDVTDKQNEGNETDVDLIHEEVFVPQSYVHVTEEPSIPEEVGSDKIRDSSESVQPEESTDAKENLDITVVKDDLCPESAIDKSKSRMDETENKKDHAAILSSEISTHATDNIIKLISTHQGTSGVTTENEEHCREPDLAQDEKIQATVIEETITEKEMHKDNGISDKDVDDSIFGNAAEEDISQKEAVIEPKDCLQDVEDVEAPYAESERHSAMDEDRHGEMSEIKSEATNVECVEEKEDVENQVQALKNDLEEPKLSESEKDPQFDHVVGSDIHALKMEDKNPTTNIDEKQTVETSQDKMDEDKKDEEKYGKEDEEECKPDESGRGATTVETKDSELKSIQKCDQSSESSQCSSNAGDHKLGATSELQSEVKEVESGKKKQDVFNQDQAEMKIGSGEQMELPESQGVKQFDVVNETINQPPQMAEQFVEERSFNDSTDNNQTMRTDTNVEEDKTDDEKEDEGEHNPDESGHSATVNEEGKDAELKRTPKKSHSILAGVRSKVKHSITKVKKAITGKSSHPKAQSAK